MTIKRQVWNWETLPVLIPTEIASFLLGITRTQVNRLALKGELPGAKKIGRFWYIEKNALKQYFEKESAGT